MLIATYDSDQIEAEYTLLLTKHGLITPKISVGAKPPLSSVQCCDSDCDSNNCDDSEGSYDDDYSYNYESDSDDEYSYDTLSQEQKSALGEGMKTFINNSVVPVIDEIIDSMHTILKLRAKSKCNIHISPSVKCLIRSLISSMYDCINEGLSLIDRSTEVHPREGYNFIRDLKYLNGVITRVLEEDAEVRIFK